MPRYPIGDASRTESEWRRLFRQLDGIDARKRRALRALYEIRSEGPLLEIRDGALVEIPGVDRETFYKIREALDFAAQAAMGEVL